jgi:putative tricarboxylic transport membrane protein
MVMIVSAYGVIEATAWPWKAALFPLVIGIPLFGLAAVEALWCLFGSAPAEGETREFQLSIGEETARRTAVAVGWIVAFFAAIVLLGFPIAVPLFVLLYLKLQGREGWVLSVVMTLAVWGVFYGLFDQLLHLPFPAGWLVAWFGS